jgi:hypothetical protein
MVAGAGARLALRGPRTHIFSEVTLERTRSEEAVGELVEKSVLILEREFTVDSGDEPIESNHRPRPWTGARETETLGADRWDVTRDLSPFRPVFTQIDHRLGS